MKLDKLVKQLRRDATANPKKAALLGLMALVALYFWAPLAWGWFAPAGGKPLTPTEKVSLILTDEPATASDRSKTSAVSNFRWEKVRQLIEKDSRMVSASYESGWLDPFASWPDQQAAQPTAEPETPVAMLARQELKPGDVGLALTSVMITPRKRIATINGEIYQENEFVIPSTKENPASDVKFRVVRISAHTVKLEREDQTFLLELTKPSLAHGDEIERHTRGSRQ